MIIALKCNCEIIIALSCDCTPGGAHEDAEGVEGGALHHFYSNYNCVRGCDCTPGDAHADAQGVEGGAQDAVVALLVPLLGARLVPALARTIEDSERVW